ncbi:hypothetical protein DRQ15_08235 [candidate division KSB1 bacterium]|nr:MAG: hypothetical protein B5M50_03720 [candidate division KSB1 bacterium 4484_219]RKY79797.1 MAG: hypothetical protein DRQ12_02970 [candidate division KSB1 bacterium]RKY81154.1 MAG: hypothetical protein DRQ00_00485 [candidate division KSB1 bacterium]RKY82530.1 MAG: hypothetical protein DRP98_08840 [candidate division KSB1 bacterium]RKY85122.1 MAG: hypothetical protein DRQ11_10425 [candidate division KSB1 bacterium]
MSSLIVLFLLISAGQSPVFSQQKKSKASVKSSPQQETGKLSPESVKILLDKIEVRGWIEKPQMVYVVPGINPKIDDIVLDRSFLDEIMKPIDKKDFERKKIGYIKEMAIPW